MRKNANSTTRFHSLSRHALSYACATAVILSVGCGGRKDPEPMPSQTSTQVAPQIEPPPQLPPPIREVRPSRRSTVKVIDPGGVGEDQPKTLLEASKLAKQRQREDGTQEPIVEITDENLSEYAEGGQVILLEGKPAAPAPREGEDPLAKTGRDRTPGDPDDEDYWRNGALEIRMAWRRTIDQIADLELEAAAFRQQFYAEEDTYTRDSQIKPAWDRALDRLDQLHDRSQRYEQELETFIEDGRLAGVPRGWLNEGWELEPSIEEREQVDKLTIHEPGDIPTTDEVKDP